MLECIRCNRVAQAQDVAWLTVTLACEDLTETLSVCTDCQYTLHWTARNVIDFTRRHVQEGFNRTMGGIR